MSIDRGVEVIPVVRPQEEAAERDRGQRDLNPMLTGDVLDGSTETLGEA